jgi:arylformamidase
LEGIHLRTYYDISISIHPDIPVWEGDPSVIIHSAASIERGDIANVSRLEIGAHTGTHIDAPVHFVPGRKGIDALDLDTLIGPAYVADLIDVAHEIHGHDFGRANIPQGTVRLLCQTSNSSIWSKSPLAFDPNFVGISPDGAQWLIDRGIKLVGVDYLGVERFDSVGNGAPTHHLLLENELVIVEGLDLSDIPAGEYELICLPVKIKNSDGAPCRAILVKE